MMKVFSETERVPILRWLEMAATAMMMVLAVTSVRATTVNLAWDPSSDSTVTGYIVHYGVVGGTSTNTMDVANQTTASVPNLTAGANEFFYVTSYNGQRVDSPPSNEITYTIPTTAPNTPPTISSLSNRTIAEDSSTGALALTVGDAETAAGSLILSGASSNPTLVPYANIVFGGSGSSRTVTVTPAPNQNGTTTITLSVSDGSATSTSSFTLTVNPVNDPPQVWGLSDKLVYLNGTTGPMGFSVSDLETASTSLTVSGSSSNPALVPNANLVFGGSGSSRTLTVTPAAGQSGTATISVTVSDGSATASQSFVLTVSSATGPTLVYLPFEAESGTLAAPMAIASDVNANQGDFIQTSSTDSGTATYTVNIPVAGDYVLWARVLSPDDTQDSFYVSLDGAGEDIYDTTPSAVFSSAWTWSIVQGRNVTTTTTMNGVAVKVRVFTLTTGLHTITFRGREPGAGLDQLVLTNDRNYVPDVIFSVTSQSLKLYPITVDPLGFVTLTWPSAAGKTYRVLYKTSLADPAWLQLGQDVHAADTLASRSDYLVGNRFYKVVQLP